MKRTKNNFILPAGILGLILAGGITTAFAAAPGNSNPDTSAKTQDERQGHAPMGRMMHEPDEQDKADFQAIEDAVKNNDYDAWKTAVTQHHEKMLEKITSKDHFDKMSEAYQKNGDNAFKPRFMKGGPHAK